MEIAGHIRKLIEDALSGLELSVSEISLEHPGEFSHGDFSTNIAMALAQKAKSNPKALAEEIALKIKTDEFISRVEVAGPGFINFHLSPKFFEHSINEVLENGDDFGKREAYLGKDILVEHSSPNLFKPFHVGHVMNNSIGESISRLAEFSGARVIRVSYPSDVSLGIGKAVWALFKRGKGELEKLESESEKLKFLGECYVEGTKAYDESEEVQAQVRKITEIIYERVPGVEYDAYLVGKEITLSYFLDITKRLGSYFDDFIYESDAGVVGEEIVRDRLKDVFATSEGAIIYEGEKDGLHTRVFINKEGYPTYEAKDIGLFAIKFDRFDPDVSIIVTDHQQKEYYKVVMAAAEKIDKKWKEKTVHRTHGRMSFMGKKMSSRLGGVPTAVDVIESVEDEVKEKLKGEATQEKIDAISFAALKFTILKAMAGKDINFDPETSLSFEGDSGPYLQYTNARTNSILEKAAEANLRIGAAKEKARNINDVERLVYRFPEIVEMSIIEWAPHHIATYLLELARAFNSWYGNTKIIDPDNVNAPYNLAIAKAAGQTIKNGLYLLGIKSLERM